MDRIDDPSNVGAAPGPLATVDPAFFRRPNVGSGDQGTIVTADWCNDIQGELATAILAAGLTLTKGTITQLRDAIPLLAQPPIDTHEAIEATEAIFGHVQYANIGEVQAGTLDDRAIAPARLKEAFADQRAEPGFLKMPGLNAIIFQWGLETSLPASQSTLITLPQAFPNNHWVAFASIGTAHDTQADNAHSPGARPSGLTQIQLSSNTKGSSPPVIPEVFWLSIGN